MKQEKKQKRQSPLREAVLLHLKKNKILRSELFRQCGLDQSYLYRWSNGYTYIGERIIIALLNWLLEQNGGKLTIKKDSDERWMIE